MHRPTILILLLFYSGLSYAQTHLDSLYRIWEDVNSPDTLRANALTDYIYEGYFYTKPDSAVILADELLTFNENTSNQKGMVETLDLKGYVLFRKGDYSQALQSYQKGLRLAKTIEYHLGAADILTKIGYLYHDNEDILTALQYYERGLKIYEKLGDLDGMGSIFNEYGSIYRTRGEHEKALDYYQKGVAINEDTGDEKGNAALYVNIGHLYADQEEYSKALDSYQKGLGIDEATGNQLGIASALAGIGTIYLEQGDDAKALDFLLRSLQISETINDIQGRAATLLNISDIYSDKGDFSKAIAYCKKSLELAEGIGDIGNQESSCDCLYYAYKGLGNMKEALVYHEKMLQLADSIQTEEAAIKLQQMEFSKQLLADSLLQVEKDLEVEMRHQMEVQEKETNRNMAIGVGVFFLILSVGLYSRWRYVKKSKAIIEKEKDRSENLLLNILPAEIAEELKQKGEAAARDFELVSILFTDFKGFTEQSAQISAKELIGEINHCFKAFDLICEKYGIEKIKTIGDAYMAAGGLPVPSDGSVQNTVMAALEMQNYMTDRITTKKAKNEFTFEMRLGIHTGPVVAGIVGVKKFQYDIWGDTVNTASRMESNGEVGMVNISQDTYELIKDLPQFAFSPRGEIKVKGKGEIAMWFVKMAQV
ncbi:tetratricopeptide repeat protein [Flavobacteriaceae bacterium TP-CH-4]|uniref:Tetratricopeptide repeat protein n=1 Tax=Pelagihabitans pacificus TaxID=2696054 RepID=A0A967AXN5_9FLAO|nr:adenylate/guanylate cyclase domain-containing protein [Pelagihabitans pacificus]NHF61205.1 tetratricopeptide repeat protein [Pelagihabitans pacificus]